MDIQQMIMSMMKPEKGEIRGSAGCTKKGQMIIYALVDDYKLTIELVVANNNTAFQIYIRECYALKDGEITSGIDIECDNVVVSNEKEAGEAIIQLLKPLNLCEETIESIPYAISEGWRSPQEAIKIVERDIAKYKELEVEKAENKEIDSVIHYLEETY